MGTGASVPNEESSDPLRKHSFTKRRPIRRLTVAMQQMLMKLAMDETTYLHRIPKNLVPRIAALYEGWNVTEFSVEDLYSPITHDGYVAEHKQTKQHAFIVHEDELVANYRDVKDIVDFFRRMPPHPAIVRVLEVFKDPKSGSCSVLMDTPVAHYFMEEHWSMRDLRCLPRESSKENHSDHVAKILLAVIDAVEHIRARGFDRSIELNPSYIYFSLEETDAKIRLGLPCFLESEDPATQQYFYHTPEFCRFDPEDIDLRGSDSWGIGVLAAELLSTGAGTGPWSADTDLGYGQVSQLALQLPSGAQLGAVGVDLLARLLRRDPSARRPLQLLRSHPFFSSGAPLSATISGSMITDGPPLPPVLTRRPFFGAFFSQLAQSNSAAMSLAASLPKGMKTWEVIAAMWRARVLEWPTECLECLERLYLHYPAYWPASRPQPPLRLWRRFIAHLPAALFDRLFDVPVFADDAACTLTLTGDIEPMGVLEVLYEVAGPAVRREILCTFVHGLESDAEWCRAVTALADGDALLGLPAHAWASRVLRSPTDLLEAGLWGGLPPSLRLAAFASPTMRSRWWGSGLDERLFACYTRQARVLTRYLQDLLSSASTRDNVLLRAVERSPRGTAAAVAEATWQFVDGPKRKEYLLLTHEPFTPEATQVDLEIYLLFDRLSGDALKALGDSHTVQPHFSSVRDAVSASLSVTDRLRWAKVTVQTILTEPRSPRGTPNSDTNPLPAAPK